MGDQSGMKPLIVWLGVLFLVVVVPVSVAFVLWLNDRRNEERKGYWDPE